MKTVSWVYIKDGKVVGRPTRVHALAYPNDPGNYETLCDRYPLSRSNGGQVAVSVGDEKITCDACHLYVYGVHYALHDCEEESEGV